MTLYTRMIREPASLADDCVRGVSLDRIAKGSLGAIVVGTALFGGILGATRGGVQVAYSAIKLPLALLATLVVVTPAFHALAALAGKPMTLRAGSTLVLASLGRASLALLALSPLLWLAVDVGFGYHASIEVAVLLYAVAGLAATSVLVRGLVGAKHRALASVGFLAIFLPVFAQSAWVLRPYAGRPSQGEVPFLRDREGSFADAVARSAMSSLGIYTRPSEGERRLREMYEAERRYEEEHRAIEQAPAAPVVLEPPVEASGYETAPPLVDGTAPTHGTSSTSGTDAVVEGAAVEHAPEAP